MGLVDHVDDEQRLAVGRLEVSRAHRRDQIVAQDSSDEHLVGRRACAVTLAHTKIQHDDSRARVSTRTPGSSRVNFDCGGPCVGGRFSEMGGTKKATREAEPAPRGLPYVVPTKLRPPHTHSGLLQRADLVERLRSGRQSTLTLVSAPAGYGKTTLLTQWAAADADRTDFAWVSLDPMDSDPVRLWGHVITALQHVHDRAGERSLPAFVAR